MIQDGLNHSIIKRAIDDKLIEIITIDIRDFSKDKHRRVDDYPYGGGAGMVMQAEPIFEAYNSIKPLLSPNCPVIYMSPQGQTFNQNKAKNLSKLKDMVILCGHYEGVDERLIEEIVTHELSIGDFILTGGELPAMMIIDAVARLIPNVLNKEESHINESFNNNLLEHPHYTRPQNFRGRSVPDVLLSGNHGNIAKWRHEKAVERTRIKRPELIDKG